eukprot:2426877-Alexandrium_andersonii.AAC.1
MTDSCHVFTLAVTERLKPQLLLELGLHVQKRRLRAGCAQAGLEIRTRARVPVAPPCRPPTLQQVAIARPPVL